MEPASDHEISLRMIPAPERGRIAERAPMAPHDPAAPAWRGEA